MGDVNIPEFIKQQRMGLDYDPSTVLNGTIPSRTEGFISLEHSIGITELLIFKIPTVVPWVLPAYYPMGGFNDCPLPEVQMAFFKTWHERYGVFPALVHNDVWECYVKRPPATMDEAMKLAEEQYAFCPDIVFQGVQSLEALAQTLYQSHYWYFWWD